MAAYVELAVATNFSFLRGASHPEELVATAALLKLHGFGVTDRNSVAGVVRAHVAAKTAGVRYQPGARLAFTDGTPDVLAYPRDRAAWGRLCRLLTTGNLRAEKGDCLLTRADLLAWAEGLELAVLPESAAAPGLAATLAELGEAARGHLWLAAAPRHDGRDRRRLAALAEAAARAGVPLLAVNDVLHHVPERRRLLDVVTCIREGLTLEAAGRRLAANAERHMKAGEEMARLFREHPAAVPATLEFFGRLDFSLDELRQEYPHEERAGYATPQDALVALAWEGAARRYGGVIPEKVAAALDHELALIGRLNYAPYFLTVHNIISYARSQGILAQGRGSAANSTVCFCLEITEVDPARNELLFERFISEKRGEPPDIDVDFEHERREEVIQWIYATYGRRHAGLAATVICYRGRSAIREVGKVFGLSEDMLGALAGNLWGWSPDGPEEGAYARAGLDPSAPQMKLMREVVAELIDAPRHLSQHTGGFVITRSRLDEVMPIENAAMDDRTVVSWAKDDLEALNILKVDVLALGMLTAIRKAFGLIERHYGVAPTIAALTPDEPEVYRMISRADTIGVFQIESRAQMSMLPRLKPQTFYDLVIEVAIVRPGPIQGDMVHPYLRRRLGLEKPDYPKPELEKVLVRTLGVPLFQEQAMSIAIVAGGFTPDEADQLRRAMATFRRVGTIGQMKAKMIEGMVANGYARDFAERCFRQIEGFGEYGFPESHAASFARLVYVSAWIKCRYPDVFACALLNAQPMGFYAPAQIVRDAREHGVEVREADVNLSDWHCTLEDGDGLGAAKRIHPRHREMAGDIRGDRALRLGLRQIKGLGEDDIEVLMRERGAGYASVADVWRRTDLSVAALERLAEADAFRSVGLDRRAALWAVKALNKVGDQSDLPLFRAAQARERAQARAVAAADTAGPPADAAGGTTTPAAVPAPASLPFPSPFAEPAVALPAMSAGQHVFEDYRFMGLSLKAHPVSFLREELARRGMVRSADLAALPSGRRLTVAGVVLVRQRPGSSKGVIFMTMEDETGIANIIVWPKVFERFRPVVMGARFAAVTGRLQNESGVIHLICEKIVDMTPLITRLSEEPRRPAAAPQEDPVRAAERAAAGAALPRGRNFQ